jgi:hypothetical protein
MQCAWAKFSVRVVKKRTVNFDKYVFIETPVRFDEIASSKGATTPCFEPKKQSLIEKLNRE